MPPGLKLAFLVGGFAIGAVEIVRLILWIWSLL